MQVVDYSFARPNPNDLAAAGYVGAMRYLAPLPNTKVITGDELASLHANGLSVGLVYEGGAGNALLGAGQGTTDGNVARAQADDLGWPADRPIFFAVDRDVATVQFDAIDAYGRAFGAATGRPVGVYGSWAVVEAMLDRGVATYAWQTAAWSHNVRSKRAVLFQRADAAANPPAGTDVNDVLQSDWGQWSPQGDNEMLDPNDPAVKTITDALGGLLNAVTRDPNSILNRAARIEAGVAALSGTAGTSIDVSDLAQKIADALGQDEAKKFADELAKRLQA